MSGNEEMLDPSPKGPSLEKLGIQNGSRLRLLQVCHLTSFTLHSWTLGLWFSTCTEAALVDVPRRCGA